MIERARKLRIAIYAAWYVPPRRLARHVRRRLYGLIVPLQASRFRATLLRRAEALPPVSTTRSTAAKAAAAQVATFFAAKHEKNVPQCFDGRFTLLNKTHDFGSPGAVDWRIDMDGGSYQLWRANLSFMGYLCPAMAHDPARGLTLAATFADSFTAISDFTRSGDFGDIWNSYPVAQRILTLSAGLMALPESLVGTPEWHRVDQFLRLNVAYLIANMETELGYNHLERNLSALALYSLAVGAVPRVIEQRLTANIDHILAETIGDDGVQQERSAMYQGLVVQSLRVLSALDIWSPARRAMLDRRLAAVEEALAALTLGDDMPMMMNDAFFGETPRTSVILGREARPGFRAMTDAGYVRLAAGPAEMVFDAGPIGPDANPGHGHPDFLSIEMSLGAKRLIVDPGTSSYSPKDGRKQDRTWDRHNGPSIAGAEPVDFLGSFKVGRRARARLESAGEDERGQRATGSLSFGAVTVRRTLALTPDRLTIEDEWRSGEGDRLSRFLIPDGWSVAEGEGGTQLLLSSGDRQVRWSVSRGSLSRAQESWTCHYNQTSAAHALIVRPDDSGRASIGIDWLLTA